MHIYIGGAYNGKTEYVKRWIGDQPAFFCTMETAASAKPGERLIISDVHEWLKNAQLTEEQANEAVQAVSKSDTVFILTEIGRGVVPLEAEQRELRDRCGRVYQQLCKEASDVTRIWYGIPQIIKRSEDK
ncbi:bifunctional adenosylcobinamide kinase/adenosylcobinamide-phosphate guanylyltransferase [Sporosarcina cascadiensis]|uniref:bifunctional adenosylcobinamide kinase/adenosylcobinamide-phosphate guanylyltransferase n=1 Tax=Sporosarcina cascadiensis TaxID=2660747 RepID=UPI001E530556|nr:bifunctional adenosylcobinamide kinase/adenosylcobinamide-phosphate guanylyltransferase [Sporosarcina cascadiensis]